MGPPQARRTILDRDHATDRLRRCSTALGVPTGALRAPRSNGLALVFQSFIDELAQAAGKDAVQVRRDILAGTMDGKAMDPVRMRGVLDLVAEKSQGASGRCHVAREWVSRFTSAHRGHFAEVVQATVSKKSDLTVDHVWVAGDIGSQIINPSNAERTSGPAPRRRWGLAGSLGDPPHGVAKCDAN